MKKKYSKEDKELVNKLVAAHLPKDLTEKQNQGIYLKTGWYIVTDSIQGIPKETNINSKKELIYIDTIAKLTSKDIELFYLSPDSRDKNILNLIMYFDKKGTKKWALLTKQSIHKDLAFIINNKVLMTPTVHSQITSGVSVLWGNNYTPEEMIAIKELLQLQKKKND